VSEARRRRIAALHSALRLRADVAPPDDWLPVDLGDVQIGITRPEVASFLATAEARCALLDYRLVFDWLDDRDARTALLDRAARHLRDSGLLRGWRDEQLDVCTPGGEEVLATIERAACRALGIPTFAVHMNAFDPHGNLVVSRRADDKPIDPGMWDNLVGGMIASGETELTALARETKEEAGLDLSALTVARGGLLLERRPVVEGYMIESIQVFDTILPPGVAPRNEDGEVSAIEIRGVDQVLDAIERGDFTLESALVTLDALMRRLQDG
jgi:8-oxo-dGTP pyrophosphatase MutT (NUDIX family)